MNAERPKQAEAAVIISLGAGLAVMFDQTAWALEAPLIAPDRFLALGQPTVTEWLTSPSPLDAEARRDHAVSPEVVQSGRVARSPGVGGEENGPASRAVPHVAVRAGAHGEFDRIVFEWPEPIDHHVVHRGEEVVVSFGRSGMIDFSGVTDRLGGRVVAAGTEDGEPTSRVTLRVVPEADVRSFSLEDRRIVAIDVRGGTAAKTLPGPRTVARPDAIRELRRELEERDAVIESLLARVEQLERTVALPRGDLDRVTAGAAAADPSVGNGSLPPPGPRTARAATGFPAFEPSAGPPDPAPPERESEGGSGGRSAVAQAAPERPDTAQVDAPAPGQVEVDEEAVDRALDFTLVQQGALLLPAGRAEFTPSFAYTRRTGDFPVFVTDNGNQFLGEQDVRRNEFQFLGNLLVGLPFDSQLELGLPYNLVDQSIVNEVVGTPRQKSSDTGHGLGDFSVGLAKTVLRERNWLPDVVLRGTWDTGTGQTQNNDVVLDGGFQELTGSVSLVKRQDPLVFVGGASYQWAYDEQDDIDPGDSLGFTIGTFLAASPSTSLRVVLNQSFIDEFKVDGDKISGSDQVQTVLTFGGSAILGRNVLVDVALGVGLTDDSPDYSVSLSLPIRFPVLGF